MTSYAGLALFKVYRCKSTFSACNFADKILYPAKLFDIGLWELTKFIRIKSISGEFLTTGLISNQDTRSRFNNLKNGFNFYYLKNERPNAGYLLLSRGEPEKNGKSSIELWDLNTQELINKYKIDLKNIRKNIPYDIGSETQFRHPLLLEDGSIITSVVGGVNPLIKLDKCGNLLAYNASENFHHSLEVDENSVIYSPIKLKSEIYDITLDDGYVTLDENLNLIDKYWLKDIFIKNNLTNDLRQTRSHLNDVEPFRRDDGSIILFMSLRDQSRLLAYDPYLNKIIWIIDNAVSKQHDVDVINKRLDKVDISIFDNNSYKFLKEDVSSKSSFINNMVVTFKDLPTRYSGELIYINSPKQYDKFSFDFIDFSYLDENYIPRTSTQGLSDFNKLNNSIMIEESNNGHILEVDLNTNKPLWQFINKQKGDSKITYQLNWSRRLERLPGKLKKSDFYLCDFNRKK